MVASDFFVLFFALSCGQLCNGARVHKHTLEASDAYDPGENVMMFCYRKCKGRCDDTSDECNVYCEQKGRMCMPRKTPLAEERDTDEDGKQDDSHEDELEEENTPTEPVVQPAVDCAGSYGGWSGCSKDCGSGSRTRTFQVTTMPKRGGKACPATTETESCNTRGCPVDCAGSYGGWSGCSEGCGGGSRTRIFQVTAPQENGGKACPAATETESCNTHGCPVDCAGSYGGWSGCSAGCGGGHQWNTFHITTQPANGGKACPATTLANSCNNHGCPQPQKDCFPADALVDTPVGPKALSEVRVGDMVRSVDGAGRAFFDTVYFFGHADASRTGTYMDVKLQGEHKSLQISQKHFLPTCPDQSPCDWADHITVYAEDLKLGSYVWVVVGDHLEKRFVQGVSIVSRQGLYNPYTLNGKVVVNNVVASAHSNWMLDSWTPAVFTRHLPAVYQTLFLPGRWLYHMMGHNAANFLDMNNPQVAPEKHGYGPEFLGSCAMFATLIMWLCSSKGGL